MSNKDLIHALYNAFAAGEVANVLGAMHPDIVWNEAENLPLAQGNPYLGPTAVAEGVFGPIMADYEGFTVTPNLLVAEGDHVVSMGRYTGTRNGSGASLDAQFVHHWTLKDGKITNFQQYSDTEQWTRLG